MNEKTASFIRSWRSEEAVLELLSAKSAIGHGGCKSESSSDKRKIFEGGHHTHLCARASCEHGGKVKSKYKKADLHRKKNCCKTSKAIQHERDRAQNKARSRDVHEEEGKWPSCKHANHALTIEKMENTKDQQRNCKEESANTVKGMRGLSAAFFVTTARVLHRKRKRI
jgi:hypothetical protein